MIEASSDAEADGAAKIVGRVAVGDIAGGADKNKGRGITRCG